jgi:hypothetical protein
MYCQLYYLDQTVGFELKKLGDQCHHLADNTLIEYGPRTDLHTAVFQLYKFARGHRVEIEAGLVGPDPEPQISVQPPIGNLPEQLIICDDAKKPYIEWQGKEFHGLPSGTAEAFQKMKDAHGKPVGIGGGEPLRKPSDWYKSLPKELQEIVASDGNKGYYLTIFSAAARA